MTSPIFEDLLSRSLAQLPEMETRILADEVARLRARVAEMEKQPRANELCALRNLFAAAGRTIHTASAGGRATLEEINDAWADVCAANVANRDLPAPDVVPVPDLPEGDKPTPEFMENYVDGFDPGERSAALFGWREGRRDLRVKFNALRSGEAGKGGAT